MLFWSLLWIQTLTRPQDSCYQDCFLILTSNFLKMSLLGPPTECWLADPSWLCPSSVPALMWTVSKLEFLDKPKWFASPTARGAFSACRSLGPSKQLAVCPYLFLSPLLPSSDCLQHSLFQGFILVLKRLVPWVKIVRTVSWTENPQRIKLHAIFSTLICEWKNWTAANEDSWKAKMSGHWGRAVCQCQKEKSLDYRNGTN